MSPIVDGLEEAFAGRAAVYRLNVGQSDAAAVQAEYGQRGHPTFAVLDGDGRLAASFFGVVEAETLHEALAAVAPPDN